LEKTKSEDLQRERDEVINTTLSEVKNMKKIVADVLKQNVICVYGNEEKIQSQKELFGSIQKLTR
jgi:Zn-dependent M16 (insulinase) family peptidase